MKAKEIIKEITNNKSINVKLVEDESVLMSEVFVSLKVNQLAKEVANEIVNALDKSVHQSLTVKTRQDEYGRNFYKELDKDFDVLIRLLPAEEAIEEVTKEVIEESDEDVVVKPVVKNKKSSYKSKKLR